MYFQTHMKKHQLFGLLIFCPLLLFGQFLFEKQTNVPFSEGTRTLLYPWAGGLNNPQFSAADLNNDDVPDLVIFDRTGDKVVTFINNGTAGEVDYAYHPEYEAAFEKFFQWMLMRDFDCDGIDDVFTYNIGAIDYYKGRFDANNRLVFDSVTTFEYPSFSGILPIFITSIDIPAIEDINNDGDLDILTFEQLGGVVDYFENQSQELTGTCGDTVIFKKISSCWGDFYEPSSTNICVLDSCGGFTVDSCIYALKTEMGSQQAAGVGEPRHAGSTLLAFDEDGDGDKELILGDISFDRINRLVNNGTPMCADMIAQDSAFPSYNVSYRSPIFPASFYVDVNNDGLKDLLVAPNAPRVSENYSCSWYYKNVGTADSVVFEFQTDTFLIKDMLDLGEGAYPAFFDYNSDGLLDIVVGNYGYYVNGVTYRSGLALLENTGTAQLPAYKLISRDYESVSALNRKFIAPTFGDMDNDGDMDMIVGEFDGFLHYYENTAGTNNPANFVISMLNMFSIDVGQFSTPFIYDVNGDGLPDLLVGEKTGNINYFENGGTPTTMLFDAQPTNSFFGQVDVRIPGFPNGYSSPFISPLDTTGKLYLLSGCEEGVIRVYDFNADSIYGGMFRKKFNYYSSISEGERTSPAIADITGDGRYEMLVGNYRGGVAYFSQSDSLVYPVSAAGVRAIGRVVDVFPNPTRQTVNIRLTGFQQGELVTITLVDMLGKTLTEIKTIAAQNILSLPQAHTGMFFVRVQQDGLISTHKLIVVE